MDNNELFYYLDSQYYKGYRKALLDVAHCLKEYDISISFNCKSKKQYKNFVANFLQGILQSRESVELFASGAYSIIQLSNGEVAIKQ